MHISCTFNASGSSVRIMPVWGTISTSKRVCKGAHTDEERLNMTLSLFTQSRLLSSHSLSLRRSESSFAVLNFFAALSSPLVLASVHCRLNEPPGETLIVSLVRYWIFFQENCILSLYKKYNKTWFFVCLLFGSKQVFIESWTVSFFKDVLRNIYSEIHFLDWNFFYIDI